MTDDELLAALDHAASHWTDAQPDVAEAAAARIRALIAERDEARMAVRISGADLLRVYAEHERLRALLREVRDGGLIYWAPVTERGHREKALMLARIEAALGEEAAP